MATSDGRLVERARRGDTDAVAAIYDRYGDRVFGLCLTLLRDRDAAADATQDTFLAAWERIEQLRDPDKLRPWLFAIARNRVIGRRRASARSVLSDEVFDVPVEDRTADSLHTAALGRLMWDAAEGLEERDRLLLELSVRQGLEGAELAEAMGIPPARAYTLTNRVKGRIERALGALLVARLGRDDCDDLGTVLAGWDGRFDIAVRRRVVRHVDGCARCSERRATLVAPASLFGALPVLAVPDAVRERVLQGYSLGSAPDLPGLGDGWSDDGWPPAAGSEGGAPTADVLAPLPSPETIEPQAEPRRPRRALAAVAAGVVVAVLGATVVASGGDGDDVASRISPIGSELSDPEAISSTAPDTQPSVLAPTAAVAAEEASVPTSSTTAPSTSEADDGSGEPATDGSVLAPTTAPPADAPPGAPPVVAPPDPPAPTDPPPTDPPPTVTVATTQPGEPTTTIAEVPDTTGTTTPPVPEGGSLAVVPGTLTLDPGGTGSFRISNAGPGTVAWSASPSVGLGVSPASGSISNGGSRTVTVSVGRRSTGGTITINGGTSPVSVTVVVVPPTTTTLGLTAPTTSTTEPPAARIVDDDFEIEIG